MSDETEKPVWSYSRFASTQAVRDVPCPKCNEAAGVDCRLNITGTNTRRLLGVHPERVVSYRLSIGTEEFKRRHISSPATVTYTDLWGPQAPKAPKPRTEKPPTCYAIRKGELI